jgi:SAM-dependent methyltransferase
MDIVDFLSGRRDPLVPPRRLIFVGAGDFRKIGAEFLGYFVNVAQLKRDESVLDVGCGVGRIALALTQYLDSSARYEGLDVVEKGIEWCQANISPRHKNFHFVLADIFNAGYNPSGKILASEYVFPFTDNSFDFVFLTSVFTHMLPNELEHYMSEIARVTRKGGRCLITSFLLNEEALALIARKESSEDFAYVGSGYRTIDAVRPDRAVAYDETFVRDLFSRHRFAIQTVRYGSWCKRQAYLSYQDIVVATRN